MTVEIDRDPAKEPSLADMARKAISLLSKDKDGFFLMVEGSQIDYAGHDNDAARNVHETLGLDAAVAVAMSFAATNPDTLVIVAADHETGALSIGKDYSFDPVALRSIKASYGRIAKLFNDDRSNVVEVMKEYAGIDLTHDELMLIKNAENPVQAVTTVLNNRIGVIFASGNHSGVMLPLSAHGADAELFAGFYDNTDIPKKIAEAMGLDF